MGEDLPRAPSGGALATLNSPRFPHLSPDVQVYHVKLQGFSRNWFRFDVGIQLKLMIFSQLKLVIFRQLKLVIFCQLKLVISVGRECEERGVPPHGDASGEIFTVYR